MSQRALPNGDILEFDDDTPPDIVEAAVKRLTPPEPKESPILRAIKGFVEQVNPVPLAKSMWSDATGDGDLEQSRIPGTTAVLSMVRNYLDHSKKAAEEAKSGNLVGSELSRLGAIPVVGGLIDKARSGDLAGAAGGVAGIGATAGLSALPKVALSRFAKAAAKNNPRMPGMLKTAVENDIPVDFAEISGSPFVKATKSIETVTPLSEGAGYEQNQSQALQRAGRKLAGDISQGVTTKATAGANIGLGIRSSIKDINHAASESYGTLRQIAEQPQNVVHLPDGLDTISTFDEFGQGPAQMQVPRFKQINGPVDLSQVQAAAKTLIDDISEQIPLAQRESDPTFHALNSLANRKSSVIGIDTALAELSAFQNISRSKIPQLRSKAEGLAAKIVKPYRAAVDQAAANMGPEAVQALEEGRALTRQKYELGDLLNDLTSKSGKREPVRLVNSLIANEDAGIEALKRLNTYDPKLVKDVGRATVESILNAATKQGDKFNGAQAFNRWSSIGPEAKALLVKNPELLKTLDQFFELSKITTEEFNPSRSGQVAALAIPAGMAISGNPAGAVGYVLGWKAVSKILYRKDAAQMMLELMQMPADSPRVKPLATTLYLSSILPDNVSRPKDIGGAQ